MPQHSYSRIWLHLVWNTIERRRLLQGPAAARVSGFLHDYAAEIGIYMKINYVNAEHVHAIVDLPVTMPVEEMMNRFKGASSRWINENQLVPGKFGWGRGYGVFGVSHSGVAEVANYVATQEEHHRTRTFKEELELFLKRHELVWRDDGVSH